MPNISNHFYKERVALNILANSLENAKEVYLTANKYAFIGVLSKNYPNTEQAIQSMKEYGDILEGAISIGLGSGDSQQAAVVASIAKEYAGHHINQVFPYVGITRANLQQNNHWINSLVSPTGEVGYVNISTGPFSEKAEQKAIVPVKAAISLIRDMGGNAIKFFPMKGLSYKQEYKAVAKACGEEQFGLEPTGGIDLENFEEILQIALEANVPTIIPHVYSSIIDHKSGKTKLEDVSTLLNIMKKLVDQYV